MNTKLKCGDVREDGMVFWCYQRSRNKTELWMTSEKFAERKAANKAHSQTPEAKAYQKAYSQTTEAKTAQKARKATPEARAYHKAYRETPEAKAAEKARQATPEAKASAKARKVAPEARAAQKAWRQTPEARASKKARSQTSEAKAARNTRVKNRRVTDPLYDLSCRLRCCANKAFRNSGFRKTSKTAKILGCTFNELFAHIEKQFVGGMSWHNRELWHIDHILPLASATTEEEIVALCHYTNLRPLWATDNLAKSDRLPCGNLGRRKILENILK